MNFQEDYQAEEKIILSINIYKYEYIYSISDRQYSSTRTV